MSAMFGEIILWACPVTSPCAMMLSFFFLSVLGRLSSLIVRKNISPCLAWNSMLFSFRVARIYCN